MPISIEAQGHTVDEAIQIALNQLGVSRDKVEIDILHHPRRGLLGIGARRAKVRATIRASVMLDGEEFDMSGGTGLEDKPRRRRRRGGRTRAGGREETAPEAAAAGRGGPREDRPEGERRAGGGRREGEADSTRARTDNGARSRDDRRGGGRGRGEKRGPEGRGEGQGQRGGQSQGAGQAQPAGGAEDRQAQQRGPGQQRDEGGDRSQRGRQQGRDQGDRRDRGRGGSRGRGQRESRGPAGSEASESGLEPQALPAGPGEQRAGSQPAPQRPPRAEEVPPDAAALDAIRERAHSLVEELLAKMGFAGQVTSSIDEVAGEAIVSVRSENEGLLIGRRGQTLDSLEHIVNRMALRGDAYVEGRVLLDIGDYRRRRRESLEELAARLRTRAVGERRTVQVSPMSPRDRKFFAQVFAGDDAVEVRALGAGFYRRVIVAPAGMGAAAIAAAEAAGESEDAEDNEAGFGGAEADN